jgi:exodeoxyribonuclease-1
VYDLRYDPAPFVELSQKQMAEKLFAPWEERQAENFVPLPVKQLQYNRCPAVAPMGVLAQENGWDSIGLDETIVQKHLQTLLAHPEFAENIRTVFESKPAYPPSLDPEAQLYDGFVSDRDKIRIEAVRNATERQLADFRPEFSDERLPELLVHYKARNYPKTLSEDEMASWEAWRIKRLTEELPSFQNRLVALSKTADESQQFILQELQLWVESILPID